MSSTLVSKGTISRCGLQGRLLWPPATALQPCPIACNTVLLVLPAHAGRRQLRRRCDRQLTFAQLSGTCTQSGL